MLEHMRKALPVRVFVFGADVVPHLDGHDRCRKILQRHNAQTIVEHLFIVIEQSGGQGRGDDEDHDGQERDKTCISGYRHRTVSRKMNRAGLLPPYSRVKHNAPSLFSGRRFLSFVSTRCPLPNCEHAVDRATCPPDEVRGQFYPVLKLSQPVKRIFEGDSVHVRAADAA